jgi:Acetyltransferases, including N-acetylases of ribosomal proteins
MNAPAPAPQPPAIRLRPVTREDLEALFEMQSDPKSNEMAGTKPRPRELFFAVWEQHFANPQIRGRVIELEGRPVGSIACFQAPGDDGVTRDHVGYWIARGWWGMGIASRALELFLREEPRRPLYATAASGNIPSRRILEKCGFRCTGFRMGEESERFAARELAEFVLASNG